MTPNFLIAALSETVWRIAVGRWRPRIGSRKALGVGRIGVAVTARVVLLWGGLFSGASASTQPRPITLMTDCGRFGSIGRAAQAERLVDWRDQNLNDDRACTDSFAATELRHFLARALQESELSIKLSSASALPERGTVILLISDPKDARLAAVDTSAAPTLGASDEAFRIFTQSERFRRIYVIQGRGRVGTLYGVYSYLGQLGYQFYGLGEQGIVPPPPGIGLPPVMRIAEQPAFATRGFWAWEPRGNPAFFLWMARNRMNLWTAEDHGIRFLRKLGIRLTEGGHNIQKIFLDPSAEYPYSLRSRAKSDRRPPDPYTPSRAFHGDQDGDGKISYFEAHPEWYGLVGGVRSSHIEFDSGDNYCTSNADATHELAHNLVESLFNGAWREADDVMFWMLDNGHWCTCDRCRAQGTPTDRLFAVLDSVSAALMQARATGRLRHPVTLMPLAFLETMPPPTRPRPAPADENGIVVNWFPIDRCYVHSLADSTCTEINQSQAHEYLAWASDSSRGWRGPICVGEYYNVGSLKSLPVVLTHVIGDDVPWYYHHGARPFHYMHVPTAAWGPLTLNHAILARLLWNPELRPDSLADEYYRLYYPSTSGTMSSFYTHLETATANLKLLKHRVRVGDHIVQLVWQLRRGDNPFPLMHMRYDTFRPPANDGPDMVDIMAALQAARGEITTALAHSAYGVEHLRLEEDEERFSYCEATLMFYNHLIRLYILGHEGQRMLAEAEWPLLRVAVDRLRAMKNVALDSSTHANAKDGMDATGLEDVYRSISSRYSR